MRRRLTAALGLVIGGLAAVLLPLGALPSHAQGTQGETVIGSVLDSTGSPLEGVAVTVTAEQGDFSLDATTDPQGTFIAEVPEPGPYRVTVDPASVPDGVSVGPGLREQGRRVLVPAGESGSVSLSLRRQESLTGTLSNNGEPLEGVRIVVEGVSSDFSGADTSDADGLWTVVVNQPGTYQVSLDEGSLPEDVEPRAGTSTELDVEVFTNQQRAVLFAFGESDRQVLSTFDQILQLGVEGVRFGLLLALTAVGLSLIFGTTGLVNFAHGEIIGLGAIITLLLNTSGVPFFLAGAITVVLCGLVGGAQELGLWRPLRKRRTGLISMMIVTIGLSILVRFVYLYAIGGQPQSYAQYVTQAGIQFGPVSLAPRDFWSMGIAAIAILATALALIYTRIGKAMRAVSDNPSLAAASGIDVERVILVVWVAGSALAGLGGLLLGLSQQVKWDAGFELLLLVFAGVILGGLGTAFGALVGSLVVGLFVTMSTLVIPAELKNLAAFVVLILILMFRPQGILGRSERVG